jgi:capsid protein
MVEVRNYEEFYRDLESEPASENIGPSVISVNDLEPSAGIVEPPTPQSGTWAGDKYYGGFGPTQIYEMDYEELRARSAQLFTENLYCRGLVRRYVTNIINTGITVESVPIESVLGLPGDSLTDWSENVENLFELWAENPQICDYRRQDDFWELQRNIKLEALVSGDVLIILHINKRTGLPQVQVVNSSMVQSPGEDAKISERHTVEHGVELDKSRRQVAYWVASEEGGEPKRVPAWGARSGRRVAWLVYGTDKRYDEVRGEPLLSLMLQHAKELDRSRDGVLRKAAINNVIAIMIEREQQVVGSRPFSGGAIRKTTGTVSDEPTGTRNMTIADHVPGVFLEHLAPGEKAKPFSNQANDVNWQAFEQSILDGFAWAAEMPPAVYRIMFSANYSASQGEINIYKLFLNKDRKRDSGQLYKLIYNEFFISSVLMGNIPAAGFLEGLERPEAVPYLWCVDFE